MYHLPDTRQSAAEHADEVHEMKELEKGAQLLLSGRLRDLEQMPL